MTHTVEATYENGVLKLASPLPLKPNEKVRVTVESGISLLSAAHGMIQWNGDPETLKRFAEDAEFDPLESP